MTSNICDEYNEKIIDFFNSPKTYIDTAKKTLSKQFEKQQGDSYDMKQIIMNFKKNPPPFPTYFNIQDFYNPKPSIFKTYLTVMIVIVVSSLYVDNGNDKDNTSEMEPCVMTYFTPRSPDEVLELFYKIKYLNDKVPLSEFIPDEQPPSKKPDTPDKPPSKKSDTPDKKPSKKSDTPDKPPSQKTDVKPFIETPLGISVVVGSSIVGLALIIFIIYKMKGGKRRRR